MNIGVQLMAIIVVKWKRVYIYIQICEAFWEQVIFFGRVWGWRGATLRAVHQMMEKTADWLK
jgi:hypothetical protein